MQFLVPKTQKDRTCTSRNIPKKFNHLKIPFSEATVTHFPSGTFLSQEIKGEGFTIGIHHLSIDSACTLMPFTKKPLITIQYTYEGSVEAELVSFGKVSLHDGVYQLFCVPPNTTHKINFKPGNHCFLHIDISKDQALKLNLNEEGKQAILQFLDNPEQCGAKLYESSINSEVNLAIQELQKCSISDKNQFDIFLNKIFYTLLQLFNKSLQEYQLYNYEGDAALMRRIQTYINGNLGKKLKIAQLSRIFHISEREFYRLFSQYSELCPYKYITQCRMNTARELLLTTEMSITDIALMLGYSDLANFSNAYHKYFGVAPSSLRS